MWGSWAGWWCGALAAGALLLLVLAQRCRRRKKNRHTLTVHIIRDALPPRPLQPPRVTHPYFPFPITPAPPRRTLATLAGAPADDPQNIPPQIVIVRNSTQNTIAHNSGQNPQPSSSTPNPQQEFKGIPKLPLPEQWLHKRPLEYKYSTTIPRPFAQIVSTDLGSDLSQESRAKKFSATRSPSLEKDDKSPFITSAKSDKVFGFDTDIVRKLNDSREIRERMESEHQDVSPGNLRRFRSVSTRLNMCSVNEGSTLEGQLERLEMQNSPRVLECSSAKEKSSAPKFDFSPKILADCISSPRFFTPPETVSPMFFAEPSPKSVYYDTVRSPKFFPETPRDNEVPQSPRKLGDHLNRNGLVEKPSSPKILTSRVSPKVHSYNKENYFNFDQSSTNEEVAAMSPRPRKYTGRNSIEKERFTPPVDKDVRKYRRHNSCDTNYRTIELNITNDNRDFKEKDMVDCCTKLNTLQIESKTEEKANELIPNPTNSAQARRQRLKSISLDSDNAKIIEQNLGLPIAKQMKDQMNEAYKNQEVSTSCEGVDRFPKTPSDERPAFKFDADKEPEEEKSPVKQKKSLRQSSDTQSFLDMPRFSPKEFEITVTTEEEATASAETQSKPKSKNLRNLTIDLTKRDSDLERELVEFEKLYTDAEEVKVKTPISKIKASSLDSSESVNLSLPQKKTLEVPQNSISVPNTPKRQLKRILVQKNLKSDVGGAKFGCNSIQSTADQRRLLMKAQDSGIYLRENHASLMLYQPSTSRLSARTMRSFDENMTDFSENAPEINVSGVDKRLHADTGHSLGSNLLNYKQNLSVSSTNLKTLPEGVPSDDFEPSLEDEKIIKKLHRRNSNQSLMLSSHSLQGSNCSLNSAGTSCHNLATVRTSISNFSLSSDRLKKLSVERRDSNASLANADHITPTTRVICSSNLNLSGDVSKNCLLQRRGSNNSLTLNIHSSNNLSRHSSNSSLNKDAKPGQKKGLLERRSSNTSLTLNINTSNPQLSVNKGLSISNYNLNGSACNLSIYNSNHSIDTEQKKGILERRSSNTSLTLNIQPQEPRDLEIDEAVLENNLKELPHRDKHRKSLSTENLLTKSYKNRGRVRSTEHGFGSHDNLWSSSYVEEDYQQNYGVTYVYGDQEDELVYAVARQDDPNFQRGFVRNISTKPLSPQTTSEDFRLYLANMQHLQNASSVLTRKQLRDLNEVFQNGYSKVKCHNTVEGPNCCSGRVEDLSKDNPQMMIPEPVASQPCSEYQKKLLRNLHQEFWDMPTNFQEKPIVSGSHPKNRYKTILPNEHSRFILRSYAGANEGYINANFIKGHEYTKNTYIATQGPLQNTIYDFWLMVYQNGLDYRSKQPPDLEPSSPTGIQKVVMLTNFIENNRQKCEKYFPMELDEEVFIQNPDGVEESKFFVRNSGMVKKAGYTIRKLDVRFHKVELEKVRVERCDQTEYQGIELDARCTQSDINILSTPDDHDTEGLDGEYTLRDRKVEGVNQTHERSLSETETDTYPNYMTFDKVNNKTSQILFSYEPSDSSGSGLQYDISRDYVRKCDSLFEGNVSPNVISVSCQTIDSDLEKCSAVDDINDSSPSDSGKCERDNDNDRNEKINVVIDQYVDDTDARNENVSNMCNASTQTERDYDVVTNRKVLESVFVVYHYWFHNWADHKCPKDVNALLNLSLDVLKTGTYDFDQASDNSEELCKCESPKCDSKFVFPPIESRVPCEVKVNLTSPLDFAVDVPSPPAIVHCSAGIGRTGCLIAILNGIKQLTNDQKVDVLGIVCNMRLNRGGMVQNSEQYELIHKVLCLYEQACLPEL